MIRRPSVRLATLLAGGALLAGCGSSSTTSSSISIPATTATTAPSTTAATTTTPTTTTGATNPAISAAGVQQILAQCKAVIARAPTLSAATKAKVESICNKASSGDVEGARKAGREVCEEVIKASPVPAPAKEQALAACKKG
jgi:hypothetical protein